MTVNDSVELLFRCRMEGGAEVDKLAASVREVSGASALASDGLSSLEASITALTAVVAENTAALAGMETGLGGVGRSAATATVSTKALTNEMKMLEGAMPIKAAASFLANLGGIGTAMQMAFPIFGAVALVGYLGTLIEKTGLLPKMWDDVAEAQKSSQELLEKSTKEYDRHLEKLKQIRLEQYELAHGKDARRALEASELQFKAATVDQQDIDRLQKQVDALKFFSTPTTKTATQEQRFYAGLAGLSSAADDNLAQAQLPFGLNGESFGSRQEAAKKLLPSFEWALRAANVQKVDDQGSGDLENSKIAADQKKKADEDAAKRKRELAEAEKQAASYLREAQNFELTGLERINEVYREKLALLGKTKKAIADINAAHDIEVQRELQRVAVQAVNDSRVATDAQYSDKQIVARATMESTRRLAGAGSSSGTSAEAAHTARMGEIAEERKATADRLAADIADAEQIASIQGNRKEADKLIAAARRKADHDNAEQQAEEIKANTDKQLADIAEVKRANEEAYRIASTGDAANANKVQRQLEGLVRQNQLAVHGGSMTGASAAESDYNARIAAAQRVLDIETSHLYLLKDEKKEAEKLADFQAKAEEARYRAAVEFETALEALREQDLKKYEQMAGSMFDALHSHSMGKWFKSFALGQEKQIFTNMATPVLQNAGHALGGLIPSINIPGIGNPLKGTIFDHANSGVDLQQKTADNTAKSADWLGKIYTTLSGQTANDPSGATPDIYNLPTINRNNPLSLFGSDIGGWTGNGPLGVGTGSTATIPGASALFNAGSGSGLTQFFSGLGGAGSNPLQAIFSGMSTNNGTVTQLTGAQQAGAAVGTGAMLAGAGLSIASGLEQGGVGGYTKAASAGLGAAAMLDPEPISKTILASVAAVTGLVGSLFATGPEQRLKDITNDLAKNQYLAPTALNVMQGMNGTYEDFDARGNLRTSTMSAVPTVAEPYITSRVINGQRQYYDVSGNVTSPYSGGASGTGVAPVAGNTTVIIQAMDQQTFHEWARQPANSNTIGEALADHLQRQDGRAASEIRKTNGN